MPTTGTLTRWSRSRGSHRRRRPAQGIDYRMTVTTGGDLNPRLDAHGDYDIGVFAHNLIGGGWRFGLRIVGSLKSQPILNVLTIYEK